jgi:hypothetical protein
MLAKLTVDLKYVEEQFDKTLEIVPLGLKSQAAYLDQLREFFDQNGKARGSVKFLDAILNQIGPQQYVNKVRIIKDGLHGAVQANNAIVTSMFVVLVLCLFILFDVNLLTVQNV